VNDIVSFSGFCGKFSSGCEVCVLHSSQRFQSSWWCQLATWRVSVGRVALYSMSKLLYGTLVGWVEECQGCGVLIVLVGDSIVSK